MKLSHLLFFSLIPFWDLAAFGYTHSGGGIYQSNGSAEDTQAAIDAAVDGNTVQIPNGTWTWAKAIGINGKSIHLRGETRGGVTILDNVYDPSSNWNSMIYINPSQAAGNNIEIANLVCKEGPVISGSSGSGTHFIQCERISNNTVSPNVSLVHDCDFRCSGHFAQMIDWVDNGGVIWNCLFDSNYQDDVGLAFKRANIDTFKAPSTMGTLDTTGTHNTYVEDCQFSNLGIPSGGIDVDDGARTVFRHCAFTNAAFATHGQETSPYGLRFFEVYNCTFELTDSSLHLNNAISSRGATFVIHDNTISSNLQPIVMIIQGLRRSPTAVGCPTQYPVARQIGQGWSGGGGSYGYPELPSSGTGYITDPVYIWNNNRQGVSLTDFEPDQCGHNLKTAQFVKEGRDYFVGQAKPGYTPYPYPHPLRASLGGAPTPTPAPTSTPTPVPTPSPTPTPGAPTYEHWIQQQNNWIRANPPKPD